MTVGILQKFVSTGSYVDICYLVPHAKDPKILDEDGNQGPLNQSTPPMLS